ncbi:MAG: flagellin [bacterium]
MGLSVRFDLGSTLLARNLNTHFLGMKNPLEKLSSGLKINRASDGPAVLVISEQLRSQIATLNQEIENTTATIGKYETGSSYTGEMRSKLSELRSLAVGAANSGGNSESAQQAYETTGQYIVSSYNDMLGSAEYNGMKLLDGSQQSLADISELEGIDLSTAETAEQSIATIDAAIAELDSVQVNLGATQKNELETHRASLQVTAENLQAAESVLRDTDYAKEYASFIGEMVKFQVSASLWAHSHIGAKTVLGLLST